jgi:hypothetical protein
MLPKSCHLLPFVAMAPERAAAANALIYKMKSPFKALDLGKHGFSAMAANGLSGTANRGRQGPATHPIVRDPAPEKPFWAAFRD